MLAVSEPSAVTIDNTSQLETEANVQLAGSPPGFIAEEKEVSDRFAGSVLMELRRVV
jgi:hypothetical protein